MIEHILSDQIKSNKIFNDQKQLERKIFIDSKKSYHLILLQINFNNHQSESDNEIFFCLLIILRMIFCKGSGLSKVAKQILLKKIWTKRLKKQI